MKDQPSQNFRWAAHTGGTASAKPKDYEPGGEVESPSAYAAWALLRETESALRVGDILEDELGGLRIFKYVGFEEARWVLPEVRSGVENLPAAAGAAMPAQA